MTDSDFQNPNAVSNTNGPLTVAGNVSALRFETSDQLGGENEAFGKNALLSVSSGTNNVAVGNGAAIHTTSGSNNVAVGQNALVNNTTGNNAVALGQGAVEANTTGQNNIGIGDETLNANTSGSNNVAIGTNALGADTTGSNNIAIGNDALLNLNSIASATIGNIAIGGHNVGGAYTGEEAGNIVLGYSVQGTVGESNMLRIGVTTSKLVANLSLATAGATFSQYRGIDDRQAVAEADGAAITVYAVPATANTKFRISATIVGHSGTITSGIYTIKYTVNGVTVTRTVSISAVDTDASYSAIVAADLGTNITGQLTTLTGTSPTVDVTCLVEGVSSNA